MSTSSTNMQDQGYRCEPPEKTAQTPGVMSRSRGWAGKDTRCLYSTGRTLMRRPCRPWSSKRTLPSILA
jgi:hypothetical protein